MGRVDVPDDLRLPDLGVLSELPAALTDHGIRDGRRLFDQAIQLCPARLEEVHTVRALIGMEGEFDGNEALELAPEHPGGLVGLGAAAVPETVGDRGDDPGEDGQAPEAELGVLLVFGVLDDGVEGEVGSPGNRAQDDDGEHERQVLGVEDPFGAFVHPAVAEGFVGPLRHQLFDLPGPAVLELLLFGGRGWCGSSVGSGSGLRLFSF